MGLEPCPALRRVMFVMLALAAVAVEVAAVDTRPVWASLGLAAGWVTAAAVLAVLLPTPADPRAKLPVGVYLLLAAAAAAPFVAEPLRRRWTDDGYPLEIQMVTSFRALGLALGACAGWVLCLRLAGVASLFLVLFSAAMTNHPAVLVALGLYTAAGSVWLMLAYWTALRAAPTATALEAAVEVAARRERLPWVSLFVTLGLVGVVVGLIAVGPARATRTLGEWLPTSGGTGDTDPFARYGVGDGPEETAGDDARAAGMVETDKMIEDSKNALIDAVSDMYGAPHKPKDQERTVAAGLVQVTEYHGRLPDNRRPSRDFDTGRKGPKGERKPLLSRAARALFEVEGRTPLHVRVVAYETYDAAPARWAEARQPAGRQIDPDGGDWMKPGLLRGAGWYAADERHRLKTAAMTTNLVPTPVLTARWRIARVDKPEYYEWDYDGVLALGGRKRTPPGVVVTTDCRTLDPARLPESAFEPAAVPPVLVDVPAALRPELTRLAREWAAGRPRGWPQVAAVLARLRADYAHDPAAAAPADHPAPVLWFLVESRRGPDYLFATAAALLLRSLDYPARACLGYYAAPAAYDRESGHTPVTAADLHTWAEVRLTDGHWLPVEATPGYEVLGANLPLAERVEALLRAAAGWAGRHPVELAALLAVLVAGWVRRRALLDALAVRVWAWSPGRTWPDGVHRAVAVLQRRGRWAGRPRSPRQTAAAWLRGVAAGDPDLARLARVTEWAAYAPDVPPPWPPGESLAACRHALDAWTLKRWQAAAACRAGGVPPRPGR